MPECSWSHHNRETGIEHNAGSPAPTTTTQVVTDQWSGSHVADQALSWINSQPASKPSFSPITSHLLTRHPAARDSSVRGSSLKTLKTLSPRPRPFDTADDARLLYRAML